MADYNGWTNWETWNVNLWIDNEEPLYRAKMSFLKALTHARVRVRGTGPVSIQAFVEEYMGGKTPDIPAEDMHKVNWQEIADSWEEEKNG